MKRFSLAAVLVVIFLSSCTSFRTLDENTSLKSNTESVFILGVKPENYRLFIFPGSVKNQVFHQNTFRPASVYGSAQDGYLVGKAQAGDTLAITMIRVVKDKNAVLGADFVACSQVKTMTFTIPEGKVIYLGDVDYKFEDKYLEVRYSKDLGSATRFIRKNYPKLQETVEPWSYELLPTNASCTSDTYIPVYF